MIAAGYSFGAAYELDRDRRINRQIAQPIRHLFEGDRLAGMCTLRQRPHYLDEREQPIAFNAAERRAEQFAEQPDIVAQRLMRITVHGPVSTCRRSPDLWPVMFIIRLSATDKRRGRAAIPRRRS